jgi:hypothetical protein
MILSQAGVYVKKEVATGTSTKKEGTASTRVSKADSIQSLKDTISAVGQEVDDEILDKLTGKQAVYLVGIIKSLAKVSAK